MKRQFATLVCYVAMSGLPLFGCVQFPTESQVVIDHRPRVSFRVQNLDERTANSRVIVDGLDAGRVGDFIDTKGALIVTPGTHVFRVLNGIEVLLDERIYLGDGVLRPIILK